MNRTSFIVIAACWIASLGFTMSSGAADDNDDFTVKKFSASNTAPLITLENILVDNVKALGKISGSFKDATFLANTDTVYLQMTNSGVSVGDRFSVFKNNGGVKVPDSFFKYVGNNLHIKGFVEVMKVTPTTVIGKIYDATEAITIGDSLGEPLTLGINLQPKEPATDVRGIVLAAANGTDMIGAYHFAYINKGKLDGLEINDRLYVYRKGTQTQKVTKSTPEVNVAELIVVNVADHLATAYCVSAEDSVLKGATFKSAKADVTYLDAQKPEEKTSAAH